MNCFWTLHSTHAKCRGPPTFIGNAFKRRLLVLDPDVAESQECAHTEVLKFVFIVIKTMCIAMTQTGLKAVDTVGNY